jgi:hypothetical protein
VNKRAEGRSPTTAPTHSPRHLFYLHHTKNVCPQSSVSSADRRPAPRVSPTPNARSKSAVRRLCNSSSLDNFAVSSVAPTFVLPRGFSGLASLRSYGAPGKRFVHRANGRFRSGPWYRSTSRLRAQRTSNMECSQAPRVGAPDLRGGRNPTSLAVESTLGRVILMVAPATDQEESSRLMKWKAAKEFKDSRGVEWIRRKLEAYYWSQCEWTTVCRRATRSRPTPSRFTWARRTRHLASVSTLPARPRTSTA